MATSLTILRSMTRQRSDQENSLFVGNDELDRYIQDSYAELYALLAGKNQDYYVAEPYEFTLASAVSSTALPDDFYKLLGVDVSLGGGRWKELDPFNFNERNATTRFSRGQARRLYRTLGDSLHIVPAESAAGDYRLWYVPTCPVLATTLALDATSDKWRDYIVIDAAIKCLGKEESDTTTHERAKINLIKRIEDEAASRDVGRSARVQDVRGSGHLYGDDE